ncbi:MAG: hypothetical protein CMD14_09070 [Flavobacteriales bacterium]|nr:hypothetical protein [Flavobacteriales bacterium]
MEYLKDCDVLTNIFYKKNKHKIITKIMKNINNLHKYKKKVKKEDYINDLNIETNYKIVSRFEQTHWTEIKEYNMIKTVNNEKIKNIKYYLDVINNKIKKIIDKKTVYEYNLIHGDIHLGNILIKKDDLYFIDPRGYFGNSKLYGIKEYDYAKLLFGISGYSIFDNMNIDRLIIKNNNIEISFIDNYIDFLNNNYFDELTKLLVLTIWLGNNSCFRNNNKKIMSLMISFYLCEKYLQNNS